MTHHSTLVQRCRSTNSLLANELEKEFSRLENDRSDAAVEIENLQAKIAAQTLEIKYLSESCVEYQDRLEARRRL